MAIPGVLAGATVGNRWTPEPLGPWRNLMEPTAVEQGSSSSNLDGPSGTEQNPIDPSAIRPMIPLGQFRDTFIIAIDDEGIAIVDQHVAHERVLFEQVMEKLTSGRTRESALVDATPH